MYGPSDFERSGALKVFALQHHIGPGELSIDTAVTQDRRMMRDPPHPRQSSLNVGQCHTELYVFLFFCYNIFILQRKPKKVNADTKENEKCFTQKNVSGRF